MWSRLVAARTWLIVTAALGTSGCQLDPISDPTVLDPRDGGSDGRADGAADRAGDGGMPTTAPEGGPPATDARDSARDVVTITSDGPGSDGPPGSMDRPPPVDLAPDLAPDRMPDQTPPLVMGLVAHWRFDEGTGTQAADATGNGNTATLHNGTAWERSGIARGPSDFAIRLDGENDYLSAVVGSMMPRIEAAKSIAYWYTADPEAPPPSGNQRTCIALANPNMEVGIQVGVDRNRLAAWSWGQNEGFVITDAMAPPGAHHVAYTFDGTTHRLFLDGRLADSSTAQAQQGPASAFYVGTYQPTSELCAGQIDDLRVYSRALDAAELAQLAAR